MFELVLVGMLWWLINWRQPFSIWLLQNIIILLTLGGGLFVFLSH